MADESHCTFGNVSHHTGNSQRSNTACCHGKECIGFCPCQGSARSQSIPPLGQIDSILIGLAHYRYGSSILVKKVAIRTIGFHLVEKILPLLVGGNLVHLLLVGIEGSWVLVSKNPASTRAGTPVCGPGEWSLHFPCSGSWVLVIV